MADINDRTGDFVVYKRNEIIKYQRQIEHLIRENDRLKQMKTKYQDLEFENLALKHRLASNGGSAAGGKAGAVGIGANDNQNWRNCGSDYGLIVEFMQNQSTPDRHRLIVDPTPRHSSSVTNNYQSSTDGNVVPEPGIIDGSINESTNDHLIIGYGRGLRRQSIFPVSKAGDKQLQELTDDQKHSKQLGETRTKQLDSHFWSIKSDTSAANHYPEGLAQLAKDIRNKANHNVMHRIIVREWNRRPERMSRTEFFYHLLTVFIHNGCLVTQCTEHSPPCRPKVDSRILESSAPVLKSFLQCVNSLKLVVVEVELLVALENLAYAEPKYRCAVAEIMDLLFRKGVVQAIAFGEWSQADSPRKSDKELLIKEIQSTGFTLIRRSSV
ncbi:uncharacterized protein LOC128956950 [Oppia nitens]|uniref:uncharacterized protein LOC128956950 n=1 Tax=Oppia nitens TaxID=1686743 RepID=UPI0023DC0218|nr:uncharacterized protein LOC128956950 [Oppia nitens]